MIEIRWHGRGGQGSFTVSRLLGASASLFEGKHALAFPSFGPERRGAPVLAFTKIDKEKITDRSEIKSCDYIVVLDETLVNPGILKDIKPNGTILINSKHPEKYDGLGYNIVTIDATSLAQEVLKRPVTNTAMFGALIGVSDIISLDSAISGIKEELSPSIVDKNIEIIRRAYEIVKEGGRWTDQP
jgi:pyruvate ferredoxin oxidoreductase gamma subunit